MKNLNNYKPILLLLGVVLMFSVVAAANTVNITHPLESASISGTQVISANTDTNTINLTYAWFYLMHGNGTNVTLASGTTNQSTAVWNYSLDTTDFYDLEDPTLIITLTNDTGGIQTSGTSNTTDYQVLVDIDNGNPTAALSSASIAGVSGGQSYKFSDATLKTMGIDADNTIGISSCRIIWTNLKSGVVADTAGTVTSNACANTTLTPDAMGLSKGNAYDLLVQATDANGDRTNSSTVRINVLADTGNAPAIGGGGGIGISQTQAGISGVVTSLGDAIRSIINKILSLFRR